jgi:hypothetical protein
VYALTPFAMLIKRLSTIAVIWSIATASAPAAVLTAQGSIAGIAGGNNDQIDRWRSTDAVKTLDPDGDNVYGTAGYVMFATDTIGNGTAGSVPTVDPLTFDPTTTTGQATLSSLPSYITLANNGQNKVASSYGYKQIDDPRQTPGVGVSDIESGAALRDAALGVEVSMMDFTIGANFPTAGLRIGILTNNTDNFDGQLRLMQTIGGDASITIPLTVLAGQELGLHFFDITSANVGDVFTLFLQKTNPQPAGGNTNLNVLYGGVTFDAIPEPASALLLAGGVLGLALRRRRAA